MQPLISIVMPFYNAAGYLEDAVGSVAGQTGKAWELILVDDGSTDDSGSICDALAADDARIRVVHLKENGGLSMARNAGMAAAVGEYLMFMDADDWIESWLLDWAEKRLAGKRPVEWLVWGVQEEHYDAHGEIRETRIVSCGDSVCSGQDEVLRCALKLEEKTLLGYAWNKLYSLKLLRENQIEFEKVPLIEDILFNLKVLNHAEHMETADIAPYHYARRSEGSLTHRFIPDYYRLSMRRVEEMLSLYEENGMGEEAKKTLAPIYVRYTLSALQRNCDPRARMNRRDRMRFAKSAFGSTLHETLAPFLGTGGGLIGLVGKVMKTQNAAAAVLMGRSVYLINTKMSGLFVKLSGPEQGGRRHETADHRSTQL